MDVIMTEFSSKDLIERGRVEEMEASWAPAPRLLTSLSGGVVEQRFHSGKLFDSLLI